MKDKLGIKVSEAYVGISTNNKILMQKDKFYWFDTNFLDTNFVELHREKDSFFEILDQTDGKALEIDGNTLRLRGNFSSFETEKYDKRFGIFGNLGIFSSWILRTLEDVHNIYTFHACGLTKDSKFLIIPGGGGSGKTVFILSAIRNGWKIFSTEFVHFCVEDTVKFFKGPTRDGIRIDTLKNDFPDIAEKLGLDIHTLKEETASKLVVNFSSLQEENYLIKNPEIFLLFPHVEERRSRIIYEEIENKELILRNLFDSASEKIGKSVLLYGRIGLPGLDNTALAGKRVENMRHFMKKAKITKSALAVLGVKDVDQIIQEIG